MRFFKWKVNIKIKDLSAEKKVIFLANELLNQMQVAGHDLRTATTPNSHVSIDINLHNYNTKEAIISVSNLLRGVSLRGKQTTKIKIIDNE